MKFECISTGLAVLAGEFERHEMHVALMLTDLYVRHSTSSSYRTRCPGPEP